MRPRLLDLFCKAGGAAKGYHDAGFDVVGVDIEPQPKYPFEFHQADAIEVLRTGRIGNLLVADFDAGHGSPPCQDHSETKDFGGDHGTGWMLAATLELLPRYSFPWVVENVVGSPLPQQDDLFGANGLTLCGCMFPELRGLLYEDRLFQTSFGIPQPRHVLHQWPQTKMGRPPEARRVHADHGPFHRRGRGTAPDARPVDDPGRARAGHPARVCGLHRHRPARAPRRRGGRMIPHYRPAPRPRTLLSRDRGEIAALLREHGLGKKAVTEMLDFTELHGDGQTTRARVTFDGTDWTVDLFGPRKETACSCFAATEAAR